MRKRSKNFEMFYDECETNILRLLKEYNMTFASLSREIGVHGQTIARLAYGIDAPIYDDKRRKEKVKESALTICEYFHMDFAKVFPRYACQVRRNMEVFEIMPFQTYSELVSSEDYIIDKIEAHEIFSALNIMLSKREYDIFISRTFYTQNYEEIAKNHSITPARAQQIHKKALLKVQRVFVDGYRKDIYMHKRIIHENTAKEEQKRIVREHYESIKKRKKELEQRRKDFEEFISRIPRRRAPQIKTRTKPSSKKHAIMGKLPKNTDILSDSLDERFETTQTETPITVVSGEKKGLLRAIREFFF